MQTRRPNAQRASKRTRDRKAAREFLAIALISGLSAALLLWVISILIPTSQPARVLLPSTQIEPPPSPPPAEEHVEPPASPEPSTELAAASGPIAEPNDEPDMVIEPVTESTQNPATTSPPSANLAPHPASTQSSPNENPADFLFPFPSASPSAKASAISATSASVSASAAPEAPKPASSGPAQK